MCPAIVGKAALVKLLEACRFVLIDLPNPFVGGERPLGNGVFIRKGGVIRQGDVGLQTVSVKNRGWGRGGGVEVQENASGGCPQEQDHQRDQDQRSGGAARGGGRQGSCGVAACSHLPRRRIHA